MYVTPCRLQGIWDDKLAIYVNIRGKSLSGTIIQSKLSKVALQKLPDSPHPDNCTCRCWCLSLHCELAVICYNYSWIYKANNNLVTSEKQIKFKNVSKCYTAVDIKSSSCNSIYWRYCTNITLSLLYCYSTDKQNLIFCNCCTKSEPKSLKRNVIFLYTPSLDKRNTLLIRCLYYPNNEVSPVFVTVTMIYVRKTSICNIGSYEFNCHNVWSLKVIECNACSDCLWFDYPAGSLISEWCNAVMNLKSKATMRREYLGCAHGTSWGICLLPTGIRAGLMGITS